VETSSGVYRLTARMIVRSLLSGAVTDFGADIDDDAEAVKMPQLNGEVKHVQQPEKKHATSIAPPLVVVPASAPESSGALRKLASPNAAAAVQEERDAAPGVVANGTPQPLDVPSKTNGAPTKSPRMATTPVSSSSVPPPRWLVCLNQQQYPILTLHALVTHAPVSKDTPADYVLNEIYPVPKHVKSGWLQVLGSVPTFLTSEADFRSVEWSTRGCLLSDTTITRRPESGLLRFQFGPFQVFDDILPGKYRATVSIASKIDEFVTDPHKFSKQKKPNVWLGDLQGQYTFSIE